MLRVSCMAWSFFANNRSWERSSWHTTSVSGYLANVLAIRSLVVCRKPGETGCAKLTFGIAGRVEVKVVRRRAIVQTRRELNESLSVQCLCGKYLDPHVNPDPGTKCHTGECLSTSQARSQGGAMFKIPQGGTPNPAGSASACFFDSYDCLKGS